MFTLDLPIRRTRIREIDTPSNSFLRRHSRVGRPTAEARRRRDAEALSTARGDVEVAGEHLGAGEYRCVGADHDMLQAVSGEDLEDSLWSKTSEMYCGPWSEPTVSRGSRGFRARRDARAVRTAALRAPPAYFFLRFLFACLPVCLVAMPYLSRACFSQLAGRFFGFLLHALTAFASF